MNKITDMEINQINEDEINNFKDEIGNVIAKYAHLKTKNKKKYNILAVGSHPDDVEIGCGGTIAKHMERGDDVSILIMTNGNRGKHDPMMSECKKSFNTLGVKNIYFGDFADGYLSDNHEVVNFIESIIRKHNINRVYTHHPNDRHQDHRNCSLATSAASRKLNEVLLFQGPSTNVLFEPHYFIELSEKHFKLKLKALKNYSSQVEKDILNIEWVNNLAKVHGWKCKTKYAEAFALNHILRGGDNDEI